MGETPGQRMSAVRAVCAVLPVDKPRLMCCSGDPVEVLEMVERGVDVFDVEYPTVLTQFDYFSTLLLSPSDAVAAGAQPFPGGDSTKVSARSSTFKTDSRPLVEGCTCYTCRTHTRAYVLHLLNVHEMLGPTLLQVHNVHHYMRFFERIREACAAGEFAAFKAWFLTANGLSPIPDEAQAVECEDE